jgi:hypothetical protein
MDTEGMSRRRRTVVTLVAYAIVGALVGLGFAYLWADPARPHHCIAGAPASECEYPQVVHVGGGLTAGALIGLSAAAVVVLVRSRSERQ